MGKISEIVPSLYYDDKNDLIRFLNALDVEVDEFEKNIKGIVDLIDVDKCPDDKLPYLAYLTGCPLPGSNPKIHRQMLRNWPWLLKIKGTNLSFDIYLNSIGAENHRIPTYFRDASGEYIETKPEGEPFNRNGTWYNIKTHYFGIETTWNGEEYTRREQWHKDFIENVSWWLRRMKPFHAELLRWTTIIEHGRTMNLYHGTATFQSCIHNVTMNRLKRYKMQLYSGIGMCKGVIISIGGGKIKNG